MAETQTKPIDIDQIEDEEEAAPKKTTKKAANKKEPETKLEDDIAVFEPVEKAVDRKLTYEGVDRTYVQHEMGFMTKIKFFRLLSGTIRQATETEGTDFINEFLNPGPVQDTDAMFNGLLRLIEVAPDLIEQTYYFALNIPVEDRPWAQAAFENLSDDEGIDILVVLVAQNGQAMRDFFIQKLPKVGKRVTALINPAQDQAK